MNITITAKIQILANDSEKEKLINTMNRYRDVCNYISDYVYKTHNLKQFSINNELYYEIRNKFGTKSQMTQSAIKTVIARYKTILENQKKWIKASFKKPQFDLIWNSDYSYKNNKFSVITLDERLKLQCKSNGMNQYFDFNKYSFGTAKLVYKYDKFFLHIPVTYEIEENNLSDICNVVGIDRGINFLIATYDSTHNSNFVSGKKIKHKRAHYQKIRKELQSKQTSSARRRLKAIGSRENRWMQDINHCVSKALVQNNPKHTLFVLEDLTGIRNATEKVRLKNRYISVSWSFYDLEQKLMYKAQQNQSTVIKVNPAYTSQCCPICGHTEKDNRNKKLHLFTCKNCGYQSNDDRIGAMNLYRIGINYLQDNAIPSDTVIVE